MYNDNTSEDIIKSFTAKGYASNDSAGLITAVMDLVAKLEPKSEIPIVLLQNDNR